MSTDASTSPSRTASPSQQRQSSTSRANFMKNKIRIYGSSWSECGYCKGRRSSLAIRNDDDNDNGGGSSDDQKNQSSSEDSSSNNNGSRAYTVLGTHCEPGMYEALIERGWRRSGRALYKPDNRRSCCPALTIRLPTCAFQPTKAQRKLQTQVRRRLSPSAGNSTRTLAVQHRGDGDDEDDDDDDASSRHPMSVEAMDPLASDETSLRSRLDPPSFSEGSPPATGGAMHRPPKKRGRRSSQGRSLGSETASQVQQSALHSSIVPSAIDPTFVRKLQDATTAALQSVLHAAEAGIDDDITRVASDVLSLVPVQYKVVKSRPPPGTRRVTLSTSVCAAFCGRLIAATATSKARHTSEANASPADPSTPNRGELAQRLARDLEKRCEDIGATLASSLAPAGTTTNAVVPHLACRVVSVEAHVPSGQVLVHVEVDESSPVPTSNGALAAAAHSKPNGSAAPLGPAVLTPSQNSQHDASDSADRVDRWWRRSLAVHDQQKLQPSGALASSALVRWAPMIRAGVSLPDPPYEMRVTTLPAHESALDPAVHQLYVEYQRAVHGDPDPFSSIPLDAFVPMTAAKSSSQTIDQNGVVDGPIEDKDMLDLSDWNEEDVNENDEADGGDEGSLYRWAPNAPTGYKDQVETMLQSAYPRAMSLPRIRRKIVSSFDGFYEFLVENPFDSSNAASHGSRGSDSETNPDDSSRLPPGTYHQHYRLGSVLIAVGVVDLLPGGLSSVYLFYDPVFTREVVAMGKFAILKEIEFTRDVLRLPYYYLGYYIESCPKMRYKIEYKPSELLCPVTYRWVDAEKGKATLLRDSPQRHCCQLYYEEDGETDGLRRIASSTDQAQPAVHESISLDVGVRFAVTLNQLQPRGRAILEPILRTFVDEAGDRVAVRCTIAFR